jgi:hypothetical protein
LNHIVLKPEIGKKAPRVPKKRKKRGPFPTSSNAEYETLVKQASDVYKSAIKRTEILESPRIHFVLELSDKITWKPISNSVERLDLSIVEYVNEKTIRVSLSKNAYNSFLSNLEENHKYIQNIREIGLFEKIDGTLYEEITKNPEEKSHVSMEFSNVNGVENVEFIEDALQTWIEKGNYGTVKRSYLSDNILLLSGFLVNKSIKVIVSEIEALSCVAKIPKMELEELNVKTPLTLSSIVPLGEATEDQKQEFLNTIMIIDTGINRNHRLLRNHIENTFDYVTREPDPCTDAEGHGSSVAGLAIYGDYIRQVNRPSAKVIMIKNFGNTGEINPDIIEVITETINNHRFTSRVLNLSFNAKGPNSSLTKSLDEVVFLSDCIATVSAGNIGAKTIASYLDSGISYPEYINNQIVLFPADCRNVITVGSYTEHSSNFVPSNCPSPFTRSSFSRDVIKPEVVAPGGNLALSTTPNGNSVLEKQGLGICSTSHIDDQQVEKVGTSFSSPIVANIAASIVQRRMDLSTFLVKALLISSCDQMNDPRRNCVFPEILQGFGKVNKLRAVYSQDWRVCYLMQGDFDSKNPDVYHRYLFLFPKQANFLDMTAVCGKLRTGHSQEMNEYIRLSFKRPGLRDATSLKKGARIGSRKCNCTYRERLPIERGSVGVWRVDVFPHFSSLPIHQRIKYGIVIAVSSNKNNDVYSAIMKWIEPQKERLLVPATVQSPRT